MIEELFDAPILTSKGVLVDGYTSKSKSLTPEQPSRARLTPSQIEFRRRFLIASQAKSKDWGGGIWRTGDDGEKIFIKDGEARGGGPNGPVIGGKPATKRKPKPATKPTVDSSDSKQATKPDNGWKPSMSKAEADVWASGGALPGVFYHGTGRTERGHETDPEELKKRIASIKNEGFKITHINPKAGEGSGRSQGDGIYITPTYDKATRYGQVLEVRVRPQNPWRGTSEEWSRQYRKIQKEAKAAGLFDKLDPNERINWWANRNGYDAIEGAAWGQWVIIDPKIITVVDKSKPEPKKKGMLRAMWLRGETQAKSSDDGGIWRTIEGDQKIYINSKGEVRAGSPSGPAIAKVSGAKKPGAKPKPKPKPESDSEKPKPKPTAKPAGKGESDKPKTKPKQGIVDGSGKPPAGLTKSEVKQAVIAARKATKGWEKKLTGGESLAVQSWSDIFYRKFRKEIATGKQSREASEFVSALEKAPPIEADVYRGMMMDDEKIESFKTTLNAIGVGGTWQDAAPFSTSLEPMTAAGFMGGYKSGVMMKVKTKTGRYIESASGNSEEFEVVSMPGAKYRITAIETGRQVNINLGQNAEPKLYIEMEEIE